jgi:L-ascorbate metabolism protein UlaG (beta-lactamase superfamily)
MKTVVTAIGNEGFLVQAGTVRVLVDAFYNPVLRVGAAPAPGVDTARADLILVTHDHWDHFDPGATAAAAERAGALVAGPPSVTCQLKARLPAARLCTLAPPAAGPGAPYPAASAGLPCGRVTGFRTRHGREHLSYLVELPGFRFFHDGDNEDTRRIPRAQLGALDALFLATWQGADWARFVEELRPARWFLMHLNDEELDQCEAGAYFAGLCDRVPLPEALVALRPGQSCSMEPRHADR